MRSVAMQIRENNMRMIYLFFVYDSKHVIYSSFYEI